MHTQLLPTRTGNAKIRMYQLETLSSTTMLTLVENLQCFLQQMFGFPKKLEIIGKKDE